MSRRRLFYNIVVYKHEKDMLRMLDVDLFQNRILEVFVPEFRGQTITEKEATLREYLKTVAENYDDAEMIMQDKDGYFNANVAYGKLEQKEEEQDQDVWKRKKKKKEAVFNDFYKFQRKSANDRKAIEKKNSHKTSDGEDDDDEEFDFVNPLDDANDSADDIPENGLEDADYLKKRKNVLASSFQQQLAELNKKKLKTL